MADLTLPPASVDAVVSVFGLFFLDDMAGVLRRAWSWLAPRGQLAVTVWGQVVLSPGEPYFWEAVRREDSTLEEISPADRLAEPGALEALFAAAGTAPPGVTTERWRMPLASPEAFWPVIMGTSNRGVFDALPPDARRRVKDHVLERLRADGSPPSRWRRSWPLRAKGLSPSQASREVTDPAGVCHRASIAGRD